jgi:phage-related protein (TIGR01555 family)
VKGKLEELECDLRLWQGLCYENAMGGGAVMLGVNDGEDFSKPLNLERVTKLNFLLTLEPQELQAENWQNDPMLPGFGNPRTYRFNPVSRGGSKRHGMSIHESRLAIFPGIQVSRRQVTTQAGWGDAVLSRCRETLRDFQTSWAAAGLLVADFAQAVWKIKGLAEIIALDKDSEIANRITAMELARSTVRAAVIDADGEEFERKQTPVSGLPELLDRFATRLAAAADIPVTLLMGMAPAGLNATGESDIRTFYDRVKARQNRKLRGPIEKICRVAFKSLGIEEPDNWFIRFSPLWQPTDQEVAATRKTIADTDAVYFDMQVISSEEIREQRFGGREFGLDLKIDASKKIPMATPPEAEAEYKEIADKAKLEEPVEKPATKAG